MQVGDESHAEPVESNRHVWMGKLIRLQSADAFIAGTLSEDGNLRIRHPDTVFCRDVRRQ